LPSPWMFSTIGSSAPAAILRCSWCSTPTAGKSCSHFRSQLARMPRPMNPKPGWFSSQRATAWSMYSTKTLPTNSAKLRPSRPSSAQKPWGSTPRPTTCSWTQRTLVRLLLLLRIGRTRHARRFKGRFTCWSTGADGYFHPVQKGRLYRTGNRLAAEVDTIGEYFAFSEVLVRKEGFEPPRPFGHKILSLARLPVPPLPHRSNSLIIHRLCVFLSRVRLIFGRLYE